MIKMTMEDEAYELFGHLFTGLDNGKYDLGMIEDVLFENTGDESDMGQLLKAFREFEKITWDDEFKDLPAMEMMIIFDVLYEGAGKPPLHGVDLPPL